MKLYIGVAPQLAPYSGALYGAQHLAANVVVVYLPFCGQACQGRA